MSLIITQAARREWITVEGHAVFQAASLGVVTDLTTLGTNFWRPANVGAVAVLMRGFTAVGDPADPLGINAGVPANVGIGWRSGTTLSSDYAVRLNTFARWGTGLRLGSGDFFGVGGAAAMTTSTNVGLGEVVLAEADYQVVGSLSRGLRAICDGGAGATAKGSIYYSFEYQKIS